MILAGGRHPLFQQRHQQRPRLQLHHDAGQVPVLVGRARRQPRADDVHLAIRPGRQWGLDQSARGGPGAGRSSKLWQSTRSRPNYPYDAVFLHGAVSDNQPLERATGRGRAKQWNHRYEYPKIILSHNAEFFEYIEKHYGDKLPVYRGSAGHVLGGRGRLVGPGDGAGPQRPRDVGQRREVPGPGRADRGGRRPYRPEALYEAWRNCTALRRAHLGRLLLDQPAGQRVHQGPVEDQGPVRRGCRQAGDRRCLTRARVRWPRWSDRRAGPGGLQSQQLAADGRGPRSDCRREWPWPIRTSTRCDAAIRDAT